MKIYNYSKETNEFTKETVARKSPLEEDVFLIPAYATTKKPLKKKKGFAICFINDSWKYVEDNRGKDIHNTLTKIEEVCDYLGPLKDDYVLGKYVETQEEIDAKLKEVEKQKDLQLLNQLDFDSIRYIREWIVSQPDAPQALKDKEDAVIKIRDKLKSNGGKK